MKHGKRRKPYTQIGISRVPCTKCGKPSYHQWQLCANKGYFQGVCVKCDIALNDMVLKWFGMPNRAQLMMEYIKKQPDF